MFSLVEAFVIELHSGFNGLAHVDKAIYYKVGTTQY